MATPERKTFIRSAEEYSIAELCSYARDLLNRHDQYPTPEGNTTLEWDSDTASCRLRGSAIGSEFPNYKLDVHRNDALSDRVSYYFTERNSHVTVWNTHNQLIETDTPFLLEIDVMNYLRSSQQKYGLLEPQINARGASEFHALAARFAIDAAGIDINDLAINGYRPDSQERQERAEKIARAQGVYTDTGSFLPFAPSKREMNKAMTERIDSVRQTIDTIKKITARKEDDRPH